MWTKTKVELLHCKNFSHFVLDWFDLQCKMEVVLFHDHKFETTKIFTLYFFDPFNCSVWNIAVLKVAYHADFEKNIKGTMTSMADDPETKRVREIANVVSQASYKGRGSESDARKKFHSLHIFIDFTIKCALEIIFCFFSLDQVFLFQSWCHHPNISFPQSWVTMAGQ